MRRTAIRGHALQYEGRSCYPNFLWPDELGPYVLTREPEGTAYCECGEASPELPSTAARQRWHAEHKDELRPAPDTGLLWCPGCGKQGIDVSGCRECGASRNDIDGMEPWSGTRPEWGD